MPHSILLFSGRLKTMRHLNKFINIWGTSFKLRHLSSVKISNYSKDVKKKKKRGLVSIISRVIRQPAGFRQISGICSLLH